jgi:hypothetical protein
MLAARAGRSLPGPARGGRAARLGRALARGDRRGARLLDGGQGLSSTQTLIRPGTRITREINLSSNCAGTYRGTVLYQPSLGPAGQEGTGLLRAGAPGTYLVGRFSMTVP